ncbi:MAG: YcxB family protein [Planctomycetota bacterium]
MNAQRLHRSRIVLGCKLASVALGILGGVLLALGNLVPGWALIGSGVCGLIAVVVTDSWHLPNSERRRQARRGHLNPKFTYTWDGEAVVAQSEIWRSQHTWKEYSKFRESGSILLLYLSDGSFEMFPKAWFKTSEQLEDFRRQAQRIGT